MKIVFLSKWISKAGTTTHLISLCKELEQYIINLLEDEKLRIRIGEKSYIKASSEFTSEIMGERTLDAYYKVIGKYRGENEKNINFSK